MEAPQFFLLGEGLELTQMERDEDQLVLHVTATSPSALCPLCQQPAIRLHSRYHRVVRDLPCVGQQVRLILHVRKFFCETVECVRKVFAERLPQRARSLGAHDEPLVRGVAIDRISNMRQARGTLGRASGDHYLLDDHCAPGDGAAHAAGRARGVPGP